MVTKNDKDDEMTEEDMKKLVISVADEMEDRMVKRFMLNLGHGVWNLAWKTIVLGIIVLAAYGAGGGLKH